MSIRAASVRPEDERARQGPPAGERAQRLGSVLNVIYLIFTEGSSAGSGRDLIRFDVAGEAQRLVRVLSRRAPEEPEVHGLQAAIAECHALAPSAEETDWERVVLIYEALGRLAPSPVVDLNRAVALSMVRGPAAALPIVDELAAAEALATSHLLPSVRGELLVRLGRKDEARTAFERAVRLCGNERERTVLRRKLAALA